MKNISALLYLSLLVMGISLCAAFYRYSTFVVEDESVEAIGTLVGKKGIEFHSAKSTFWSSLDPGHKVRPGDTVFSRRNASKVKMENGDMVEIAPGTLIRFEKSAGTNYQFMLMTGQLQVKSEGSEKAVVLVGQETKVERKSHKVEITPSLWHPSKAAVVEVKEEEQVKPETLPTIASKDTFTMEGTESPKLEEKEAKKEEKINLDQESQGGAVVVEDEVENPKKTDLAEENIRDPSKDPVLSYVGMANESNPTEITIIKEDPTSPTVPVSRQLNLNTDAEPKVEEPVAENKIPEKSPEPETEKKKTDEIKPDEIKTGEMVHVEAKRKDVKPEEVKAEKVQAADVEKSPETKEVVEKAAEKNQDKNTEPQQPKDEMDKLPDPQQTFAEEQTQCSMEDAWSIEVNPTMSLGSLQATDTSTGASANLGLAPAVGAQAKVVAPISKTIQVGVKGSYSHNSYTSNAAFSAAIEKYEAQAFAQCQIGSKFTLGASFGLNMVPFLIANSTTDIQMLAIKRWETGLWLKFLLLDYTDWKLWLEGAAYARLPTTSNGITFEFSQRYNLAAELAWILKEGLEIFVRTAFDAGITRSSISMQNEYQWTTGVGLRWRL